MLARLGRPARRLVAVLLLFAAVAALVRGLVLPAFDAVQDRRERLAALAGELAALERMRGTRARAERRLNGAIHRHETEGLAFRAASATLAAGELQATITERVAGTGARLSSIQVLPAQEEEGLFRMTARVVITLGPDLLVPVLHAIESAVPYLVVDRFSIISRGHTYTRAGPARAPTLTMNLEATGFLHVAGPERG